MDKKIALQNLVDFTNVLEEYKVRWFLAYGTCLGALREGDFIDHDLDIDIGILEEDFKFNIINKMHERGFVLGNIFGMRHCGMEMSFSRGGVKIDLMFFYKKGDLRWNALWANGGKNGLSDMIFHTYPAEMFDHFRFYNLGDKEFKTPYDIVDYIEHVYGLDWKTPIEKWDWRTDHVCLDKNFKI